MVQNPHIPRFTLERLQALDLSPTEESCVSGHLQSCTQCRQALEALVADDAAFKAEVPYAGFRIEHERRRAVAVEPRGWRRLLVPALSAAAVAALVLFAVAVPRPIDDQGVRIKGAGVALGFAVVEQGATRQGVTGETLAAGAKLQLSYTAGDFTHVAVLGVDDAGTVTVYFPEGGTTLAPLPGGAAGALPFSLTLDATPGRERFVAVFAKTTAELLPFVAALSRAGPKGELTLPSDVAQSTVWIEKR